MKRLLPSYVMQGLASAQLRFWVLLFLSLVLATPIGALANTLRGLVVAIADGDTITVLDTSRIQHKVRLAGIDSPEKSQAFGTRSNQFLASNVFRKFVTVEWTKRDRYGRIVGKVLLDGQDINLMQVQAGLAWHYKAYASEQSALDRLTYSNAEEDARRHRRGLWRDSQPTPPWESRRNRQTSR